jgi:hypothetical protein
MRWRSLRSSKEPAPSCRRLCLTPRGPLQAVALLKYSQTPMYQGFDIWRLAFELGIGVFEVCKGEVGERFVVAGSQ